MRPQPGHLPCVVFICENPTVSGDEMRRSLCNHGMWYTPSPQSIALLILFCSECLEFHPEPHAYMCSTTDTHSQPALTLDSYLRKSGGLVKSQTSDGFSALFWRYGARFLCALISFPINEWSQLFPNGGYLGQRRRLALSELSAGPSLQLWPF